MLLYECTAVYAHNLMCGECLAQGNGSLAVIFILCVCGVEYAVVHYEEVCICGRQTLAVLIMYWRRGGKRYHPVGFSFGSAQFRYFLFHGFQVVGKARYGVDMPVGVVAYEVAVVEPQHTFGVQHFLQALLYLLFVHGLVAVWCKQALACSKDCTLAVALD